MHHAVKLKLRQQKTSYCLIEVATKAGWMYKETCVFFIIHVLNSRFLKN